MVYNTTYRHLHRLLNNDEGGSHGRNLKERGGPTYLDDSGHNPETGGRIQFRLHGQGMLPAGEHQAIDAIRLPEV